MSKCDAVVKGGSRCNNGGPIERNGKNYCWQHDPKGQAKRDIAAKKSSDTQNRFWHPQGVPTPGATDE